MKTGARVAMAIGAGYVFGRTRKMRLAMMAAAASATGILATSPRDALQRAARRALSSPEMSEITNSVRGDLAGAVRAAAFSAATSRIEALNERLRDTEHDRPQVESEPAEQQEQPAHDEAQPAARRATASRRSGTTPSRSRSSGTASKPRSGTTARPRTGDAERAPVRRTRR
ncbi:MAG: hypothetical protein GEV04_04425 [Actinophytocola sp.]|nr:hypothetical protein [Actinophytocola sp.]